MSPAGLRIGVLTGGGDCPGLNAVIRAVTRSLIRDCGATVVGIENGFDGLLHGHHRELDWRSVGGLISVGGTVLGTSNRVNPLASPALLERTVAQFHALQLHALVAIGGDGTLSIADGLAQHGIPIVGVPKTIDNDIEGCERSFGFDTAVATAADALDRLHSTGLSHGRVMILETMGRYSGWLALESGIAAGVDMILLPEMDYDIQAVAQVCNERMALQRLTLICISEGAKPVGGQFTVEQVVQDSPDPLRLGGVAHVLRAQLQPLVSCEVRATVLGHVQRGGVPTPFDRVLATRFGVEAARLIRDGQFGRMVTLHGAALDSIALSAVAHRNRRVPLDHALLQTARQVGVSFGQAA
jgi:ATP-dependent phosphofructokinase / diphosphate-dependent phosphofructokinase